MPLIVVNQVRTDKAGGTGTAPDSRYGQQSTVLCSTPQIATKTMQCRSETVKLKQLIFFSLLNQRQSLQNIPVNIQHSICQIISCRSLLFTTIQNMTLEQSFFNKFSLTFWAIFSVKNHQFLYKTIAKIIKHSAYKICLIIFFLSSKIFSSK
jgi:hypothetical protein